MQSPKKSTTNKPPKSAAILLLTTVLDTTWRAFIPTIGGTFLGIFLDHLFDLAPVLTIVMIFAGFTTSGLLVVMQVRSIRRLQ
jgi:hypothetical protein